jgi:hypothetical protein
VAIGLRLALASCVLASASACGAMTGIVDVSPVEYQASGDGVSLVGGSRSIAVDGVISTPDPCFEVSSTLKRGDGSIHLTLRASRKGSDACPAVIGFFGYHGAVTDLSPRGYHVIVSHVYEGTGWAEKRFEADVTVGP